MTADRPRASQQTSSPVAGLASSMTPEGLFAVGAVSQYAGAALAVFLFDHIAAAGVTWFRVLGAAVTLVLVKRSWNRRLTRSQMLVTAAFGITTAAMNLCFYLAIEQLPLGNAVAIEFMGPVAVAALGARTLRNSTALGLAIVGVVLLAQVRPEGTTAGFVFALLAGALWAGYIVFGHRLARSGAGIDGLGIGLAIGAVAITPFAASSIGPAFSSPWLLLLAFGTGVFSNAIPYGIDQVVLRRISRPRFALLQALLPVTAALMGLVILEQVPDVVEILGIGLVIGAIALRERD